MATHSATSIDQAYEYEDLNLERPAFRLVRLINGDGTELKCELFQAYLDERESVLPYEAVSYTWGSTNFSHGIDVDGKRLGITASLHVALQHLRHTELDRILWIDGICINQGNRKERGHQVQQMGYIYRHAERVVFWLGLATDETDEVMESLRRLTKHCMQYATAAWKLRDPRWEYMWEASQQRSRQLNPDLDSVLHRGLADLLSRTWFRRAWILQEVANAQSALIHCGKKSVSARLFPLMPVLLGFKPQELQQAVLDIMPGPSRKATWWAQNRSMYYLLRYFGSSEATESRDIIYALRGISTDANDPSILTPDYGLSEEQLLQQVSQFLFHCDITKGILVVRGIVEFTGLVSYFNTVAIGDCIRASKTEELSILMERGDINISDQTVRCAIDNTNNGLQLLRSVLEYEQSPPVLSDEAVFLLARHGDFITMDVAFRHWSVANISCGGKLLLSAVLNEFHAHQILRAILHSKVVCDRELLEIDGYFDKYLWLATLSNIETGFKARQELLRVSSMVRWGDSATEAFKELKNPLGAFSLVEKHLSLSNMDPVRVDAVPFTSATAVVFGNQLGRYGWSADGSFKMIIDAKRWRAQQ